MQMLNPKTLLLVLLFIGVGMADALAQKYPERREVRRGNSLFDNEEYDGAAQHYRRAQILADSCWEATFNLGSTLYAREKRLLDSEQPANPMAPQAEPQNDPAARFDEAVELLTRASLDSLRTPVERAEAYYNLAGVQFAQQRLQESLQSLRKSLILNPSDEDAKFNYTYVKRLLDQQQDQNQQGGDQNQEQNQDQNQEQNQNQNNDQNQQQEQDDSQKQDSNSEPQEQNQPEPQAQPEGVISPQEVEQMLEAIQAQEDETQEKLKEKRGVVVRGAKNW